MSMTNAKGVVSSIPPAKAWKDSKTGADIFLYSFQIQGDKRYFRLGQTAPPFVEGEAIQFTFNSQKGNNVEVNSIQKVDASTVARAPTPPPAAAAGQAKPQKEDWTARGTYWQNKEKRDIEVVEPRLILAGAQTLATNLLTQALANDCLVLPAKKGDRLDALLAFYDEITNWVLEGRAKSAERVEQFFDS